MLNTGKKENKKVFKSLYDVKDKYLPNADLEFLECQDDDQTRDSFLQALKKATRPTQDQPPKGK